MKLEDRVALVTGSGRGLGREIALSYASEGAKIVLVSRTAKEIDAVAAEIKMQGGKALALCGDVRSEADVHQVFQQSLKVHKRIDILVNNAGTAVGKQGRVHVKHMNLEDFLLVLHTNLVGTFLCCRSALGTMILQKGGVIINMIGMGSTGSPGRAGMAAYNASKAAIEQFTRTLAEEVKEYNIRVNNLQPGGSYSGTQADRIPRTIPRGVCFQPIIIMPLATYLASDDSKGVTGLNFCVPEWNKEHGFPVF